MRTKSILFILLAFVSIGLVQNWGEQRVILGKAFAPNNLTDNLYLNPDSIADTLFSDTFYSNALPIGPSDGIYGMSCYLDSISGAADTITLYVRQGNIFNKPPDRTGFLGTKIYSYPATKVVWESNWHFLIQMKKDTLYQLSISQSDSSWWKPTKNIIQYKIVENQGDTVRVNLNEYRTDIKK